MDIVTVEEASDWLRIDYSEPVLKGLIQISYDILNDSIDDFDNKLKSAKFKRKLKLCMLNFIVSSYDDRGIVSDKEEKYRYINQSMLLQLQYGTYLESDV